MTPNFNGVEFGTGPSSQSTGSSFHLSIRSYDTRSKVELKVTVRKEVIVSAGVHNTPQLLMLSGIGDPAELMSLGIPTRVNLPSVGKNMTDHVFLENPWQVNNNNTIDSYLSAEHLPHQEPLSWACTNQMTWIGHPHLWRSFCWPNFGPFPDHLV